MTAIVEIKLIIRTSIIDEQITSRAHTRNMNSTAISNKKDRITYVASGTAPPALTLSPMSSRMRLPRSGRSRRSRSRRCQQSRECAPQKPDRPSFVQDHERRGSGGLLSLLPVHAERRDGEDLLGGTMIWNSGEKPYEAAAARVDVCLTI